MLALGHVLRAKLWQPGEVLPRGLGTAAPYCKPNTRQVSEAAEWAPGLGGHTPSNRKRGVAANPQPLERPDFLSNAGRGAAHSPSLVLSCKLFASILSSLKSTLPGAPPPRELTGRWSLGLIRPGSPGGPGPLELGGHSQHELPQGPGNPGWVGGPLGAGCMGQAGGLELLLPPLIPHRTVFKPETRACQMDRCSDVPDAAAGCSRGAPASPRWFE